MNSSPISAAENLARYIFSKHHFSRDNGVVKYGAFLPATNGETSVFRISGIPESEVWQIGRSIMAPLRDRPLLGRADIPASGVIPEGLTLLADTGSHRLHANIVGWLSGKSEQKLIATKLAGRATLHLLSN